MYRITAIHATTGEVKVVKTENFYREEKMKLVNQACYSCITVEHLFNGEWEEYSVVTYTKEDFQRIRKNVKRIAEENKVARKIINSAIKQGYTISISDGEGIVVHRSTDKRQILSQMRGTDMDKIYIHNTAPMGTIPTGYAGWVLLIYGNEASEVMADWTDNEATNTVLAEAIAYCDKLSENGQ